MAAPVVSQVGSPTGRDFAEKIRAAMGPAIVDTDAVTSYRAGAVIITDIIAALYAGPGGTDIISANALTDIVTACTA